MKIKYHLKEVYINNNFNLSKLAKRQSNIFKFRRSEAYLNHLLFHKLLLQGIESAPEFSDGRNRYDLVVMKNNKPLCIVEVKSSRGRVNLEQLKDYERNSFKVPVFSLAGYEMFDFVYKQVLKLFNE